MGLRHDFRVICQSYFLYDWHMTLNHIRVPPQSYASPKKTEAINDALCDNEVYFRRVAHIRSESRSTTVRLTTKHRQEMRYRLLDAIGRSLTHRAADSPPLHVTKGVRPQIGMRLGSNQKRSNGYNGSTCSNQKYRDGQLP